MRTLKVGCFSAVLVSLSLIVSVRADPYLEVNKLLKDGKYQQAIVKLHDIAEQKKTAEAKFFCYRAQAFYKLKECVAGAADQDVCFAMDSTFAASQGVLDALRKACVKARESVQHSADFDVTLETTCGVMVDGLGNPAGGFRNWIVEPRRISRPVTRDRRVVVPHQ